MSAKAILVFCAHALFLQSVLSQCTTRAAVEADPSLMAPASLAAPYGWGSSYGLAGPAMAAPYGIAAPALAAYETAAPCAWASPAMEFSPTSGGGLPVSSASAIAPIGLSVASENAYEGILAAAGELPFVGTVAVEGVLPTAGAGAINHACGNGRNAMISEGEAFAPGYAGAFAPAAYGAAIAPATVYGAAALAPAATFAPSVGYRVGWADRGCGYSL